MKKVDFKGNADKEFAKYKEFDIDELKFFEFRQKQSKLISLQR